MATRQITKPTEKKAAKKAAPTRVAPKKPATKKLHDAGNKTVASAASVAEFIASVPNPVRRADAQVMLALLGKVTKEPAKMWGTNIVGFGDRKLIYESGRSMDWMLVAFAPRSTATVLYIMDGFPQYAELLSKLGKHKHGKSCLYLDKLADIDMKVLEAMVTQSVKAIKAKG